jgi:RNA polymerase sigma-70 factor (ECF subfamily)
MAGRKGDFRDSGVPKDGSVPEPASPDWETSLPGQDSSLEEMAVETGDTPEESQEFGPELPESEDFEVDSDLPDNPVFPSNLREETQLSPQSGVSEDMGTLALEGMPKGRLATASLPPSMVGTVGATGVASDADIMLRAAAGDESCFDFLVNKYRRPMIGFMYRMVHNQAVAEELTQEVFLRVYRARASYRAEARFTTWLYRIASNMAINHARDTKHERASSSVYLDQMDEDTGTKPDIADSRPVVEQDLLRDERMKRIREHVLALPERQRMAVVMHKYQDMDYKQIGAVLKLSESATKSLLFRAYQTLRDRLKEFA